MHHALRPGAVVIEHSLEAMGGRKPPEDIAKVPESYTGQFLAGLLKRRPVKRAPAAATAAE